MLIPEPILVLGAGAIGSLYAAKLAARHPVTVVARPGHVEAIRRHGLRLTGREALTARVDAVTHVDAIAAASLRLLDQLETTAPPRVREHVHA